MAIANTAQPLQARDPSRAIPPGLGADVVGILTKRVVRGATRLAALHRNGNVSNTFALDEDRAYVANALAEAGLELRSDDTIACIPSVAA